MVKLYKYDWKKSKWVFVDYGIRSLAQKFAKQGYLVIYK